MIAIGPLRPPPSEIIVVVSLSVVESRVGDIIVVGLSGEVDLSTLPRLADALGRIVSGHARHIAVDLDGITVLDDAALGMLLGTAARLTSSGRTLFLVVTNEKIRAHLHSTRLDEVVTLHSSVGEIRLES